MKIGFIGAGNMARAMVAGLLKKSVAHKEDISCVSGQDPTGQQLSEDLGIHLASSRQSLIESSDLILLAFKPQHVETITFEEGDAGAGKLIVSILAGREISSLKKAFPKARNIVRVMPNTPAKIGKGVFAYCFDQTPSDKDRQTIEALLSSLGAAYQVEEKQMHIVTAISGCGPAVFFRFVDLLSKAGDQHGLPQELALALATETGIGSLELLKASDAPPQTLVDEVTSPNGVTYALLQSLEKRGLEKLISDSITDAVNRSIELS